MVMLGVNIDHVATVRQARGGAEPEPVTAAAIVELAGADGITVHLREDRRHICDRDVSLLRKTIQTRLNLEMAATDEMVKIAMDIKPDFVCLVPEKREELTTEGGLDVRGAVKRLTSVVSRLHEAGIMVSLFIDPSPLQVKAAGRVKTDFIELHTGSYAGANSEKKVILELEKLRKAARQAYKLGIRVNAGHGLNYWNVQPVAAIPEMEELNIGHSIVSRAVLVGLDCAVREMKELMERARHE